MWGRRSWCSLALWELQTNIQQVNPEAAEGAEPSNNAFFTITLMLISLLRYFVLLFHLLLTLDLWYQISYGFIFPWDITLITPSTGINSNYHLLTHSLHALYQLILKIVLLYRYLLIHASQMRIQSKRLYGPTTQGHNTHHMVQKPGPRLGGSNVGSETVSHQARLQTITPR